MKTETPATCFTFITPYLVYHDPHFSLQSNATVAIESAKDEVESSACGTSWLPTNTPTVCIFF